MYQTAAETGAVRGGPPVGNGKQNFGILEKHGKQGGNPHPEQRACAAKPQRVGNADNVPNAERSRQRQRDGAEGGDAGAAPVHHGTRHPAGRPEGIALQIKQKEQSGDAKQGGNDAALQKPNERRFHDRLILSL